MQKVQFTNKFQRFTKNRPKEERGRDYVELLASVVLKNIVENILRNEQGKEKMKYWVKILAFITCISLLGKLPQNGDII